MVHVLIRDTDVTIQFHPFPDFQCVFYNYTGTVSRGVCIYIDPMEDVVLPLVVPISVLCCALVTNLSVNDINNIHKILW